MPAPPGYEGFWVPPKELFVTCVSPLQLKDAKVKAVELTTIVLEFVKVVPLNPWIVMFKPSFQAPVKYPLTKVNGVGDEKLAGLLKALYASFGGLTRPAAYPETG